MDHGFGAIGTLLVVAHEAAPSGQPSESVLDDQASWEDYEAPAGIGSPDNLKSEVVEGGPVVSVLRGPSCAVAAGVADCQWIALLTVVKSVALRSLIPVAVGDGRGKRNCGLTGVIRKKAGVRPRSGDDFGS